MNIESGRPTRNNEYVRFEKRPNVQAAIEKIKSLQPQMKFHVAFREHATYEEGIGLAQQIREHDLFIPELTSANPESERLNTISQGKRFNVAGNFFTDDLDVYFHIYPTKPFGEGLYRAIHNSQTPVKFIDYRLGNSKGGTFVAEMPSIGEALRNGNPDAEKQLKLTKRYAELQDPREEYMMHQLPRVLKEFINENRELAEERKAKDEPVNVLLFIGTQHTRIYHALREADPTATRDFEPKAEDVLTIPWVHQVRQHLFGIEPK
jgi:hypothetical protein